MLLSRRILNLNVLVYVSTAFCTPGFDVRESCEGSKTRKEFFYSCEPLSVYKMELDADFMIKLVENLKPDDYDDFETIATRFIQPYPNTYTFSKALSEHIVRKYGGNLNIAIVRPAIISTTFYDPLPGYTGKIPGSTRLKNIFLNHFYSKNKLKTTFTAWTALSPALASASCASFTSTTPSKPT